MLGNLHFGPADRFVLDTAARTLHADGESIALGARAIDVLAALAEADGALRTKEQLLQQCWPGLLVEEANVHVQVSALRKLLGAEAIVTVPGVGYRFAWPLRRSSSHALQHNLPAPRSRFIGREKLLADARRRLARTRLLTLIGIGGTGKTRLALQLAQQLLPGFPDGVWWVDLAPLDQSQQLAAIVARALGIASQPGRDPGEALPRWLRERRVLLLLDNCEHVLDAAAELADQLLAAAPGLKLLATSREALGVQGETVLPVVPLALPESNAAPQALLESESVRLFADRASASAPGFTLVAAEMQAVAEICRQVDGIPLALELSAAQLRVVSPPQLLQMLRNRLRPLAGQRRALPRQQTMQAVIQWSYEHLSGDEQLLLNALALCSGGADLDAAAALVGPRMPRADLLAALCRLADRSLLVVRHGNGPARYHLLETVRQFAFERLQEGDHGALLRERHVAHYLALAEGCCAEFVRTGEGMVPWTRIDAERDNLLHAADACALDEVTDAAATGLRLLAALRRYWTARGLANMGADYSLRALDRARALTSSLQYRELLASTVYMLWWAGRFEAGLSRAHELEHLATEAGDAHALALAHLELGTIRRQLGDDDQGRQHFEACRRIALDANDRNLYGDALVRLGHLAMQRGRFDEARRYYDDALPVRRESHYAWRVAGSLLYAGQTATRMGEAPRARALLREAAVVLRRTGSVQFELFMLDFAAALAALEQQWTVVVRLSGALHRLRPMSGPVLQDDAEQQRQQALQQARAVLGGNAFDAAWALGTATDLAAALDFAARGLDAGGP